MFKQVHVRWFNLLKGKEKHPKMSVDWSKYSDPDEEQDEIEVKSGQRGVPVKGDPTFKRAVDDYWRRKRVEQVQGDNFPELDSIAKLAEKEHAKHPEQNFNDIVQRMWGEARGALDNAREYEKDEEEWANAKEDL